MSGFRQARHLRWFSTKRRTADVQVGRQGAEVALIIVGIGTMHMTPHEAFDLAEELLKTAKETSK